MGKKINILLVDDHKLIRDGIKSIINTSKHIKVVGDCSNGKEAIDFLKEKEGGVNVILMDITMPELNGIDATEIITKLYPKIKILALTMHIEESYLMKMINAGALGYVLKDSSRANLIEAIKTVYKNEKFYSSEVSMKLINHLFNEDKETESDLSHREIQILKSISHGNTNKEIAKQLCISSRTVETHRRNIIRKLNVKNTAELISHAVSEGLIHS